MHSYGSPEGYLYNLHTCSPAEAKRMWKESIKTQWDNKCAYCGSDKNITLDHIVPQCKGGSDHMSNVLSCCLSCNADKAHEDWIIWFIQQPFFTEERRQRIEDWMSTEEEVNPLIYHARDRSLHAYKPRRNKSYWPPHLNFTHYLMTDDPYPCSQTHIEVQKDLESFKQGIFGSLIAALTAAIPFIILL